MPYRKSGVIITMYQASAIISFMSSSKENLVCSGVSFLRIA
ncbi:hypothetical protein [Butyrivibrio sp. WCD3002]|nr:hypothetical protein [Butyrivibrio sp. WCD3002]